MKRFFLILCHFVSISYLFSQGSSSIFPQKPTVSDSIEIFYCPDTSSQMFKGNDNLIINIEFWNSNNDIIIKEFPNDTKGTHGLSMLKERDYLISKEFTMERKKDGFYKKIKIPNDSIVYISYKFSYGEIIDKNKGYLWETFIYDRNGNILEGGNFQKYLAILWDRSLDTNRYYYLKREVELHPSFIPALVEDIYQRLQMAGNNHEKRNYIANELETLLGKYFYDEDALVYIFQIGDWFKLKKITDSIEKIAINKLPAGKISRFIRMSEILRDENPETCIKKIKRYLSDFKAIDPLDSDIISKMLYICYNKQKNKSELKDYLKTADFKYRHYFFIEIAKKEIAKEENYAELIDFIDRGINLLNNEKLISNHHGQNSNEWLEIINMRMGTLLGLKGIGLLKVGKLTESGECFFKSYQILKTDDDIVNDGYVEYLIKIKDFNRAIEIASESVKAGKATQQLLKNYEIAYTSIHGSNKGFDEILEKEDENLKNLKNTVQKQRNSNLAPEFSLKDPSGKIVNLKDLRGKIVILDFWATWCSPCLKSLPVFQKMFEKYKNMDNVRFFAINTRESKIKKERTKMINDFLKKNQYTFPNLFDTDNSDLYKAFNIESIPTKIIIDKEGKIAFSEIGYDSEFEELRKIDLWIKELSK